MSYKIREFSKEEIEAYKKRHNLSPVIRTSFGSIIKGYATITCREKDTNQIAWTYNTDNLITDAGRRFWNFEGWGSYIKIGVMENTELPDIDRYSYVYTNPVAAMMPMSVTLSSTAGDSLIKTYNYSSFTNPTTSRIIGSICIISNDNNYQRYIGFKKIYSILLVNPAKIQNSSQILEVSYKVQMFPSV